MSDVLTPIPIPISRPSSLEDEYISQLTPIEKKGYEIAKGLGTSFNLKRSNGFVTWMNTRKENGSNGSND